GQPDLEDFLVTQYHEEDLYRLWQQCRIDTREFSRRPFIGGIRKVLNLRKGQILQVPRPYVRASSGVPRSLVLLGRGANKPVQLQDIATNRGSAFMQEKGKDRYPDTQGFTLAPGQIGADDVRPGMVLAQPGWGIVSRRFTAELELAVPTKAMPERALFHFWSHHFPGVILQTTPPDPDSPPGTDCRIVVQLDEDVALEDGLPFPVLQAEEASDADRSPEVVGFDPTPGIRYRLIGIGRIASASPSAGHTTSQGIL
ncbi:MAG: hypothetical protein ACYCW6_29570, partial [Candidatus Xenobia bacterium]